MRLAARGSGKELRVEAARHFLRALTTLSSENFTALASRNGNVSLFELAAIFAAVSWIYRHSFLKVRPFHFRVTGVIHQHESCIIVNRASRKNKSSHRNFSFWSENIIIKFNSKPLILPLCTYSYCLRHQGDEMTCHRYATR